MILKKGARGIAVKRWQEFLGVEPADGIFGILTDKATREFQEGSGLRPDGIVGTQTLQAAVERDYEAPEISDENSSPVANMKLGARGDALIKSFEKCVLHTYDDGFGYPTIGWGHLLKKGDGFDKDSRITQAQADALFLRDVKQYEDEVRASVQVPLTQNQYDALVSLCFNIGRGGFRNSTLLKVLNQSKYGAAADCFARHNKAKKKGVLVEVKGLTRRRAAEKELFES
jgi:lysozyme